MEKEIVLFEDNGIKLEVPVTPEEETVWLNRAQMAELFDRDIKTIGKHIANARREELEGQVVVAKFATTTVHGAIEGKKLIDDHTLVALTIMIAESRPEEKEMMITVIMNCLCKN